MPLTMHDRVLIQRCLQHHRGAWNDFADRYLGLVYHVIRFTAHERGVKLTAEDVEDLAAEVLLQIVANNYAVLNQFRGESSLSTYLTVICRRICVQELTRRAIETDAVAARRTEPEPSRGEIHTLETLEEVQKLLSKLPSRERDIVRLYYLEGRTYEEIASVKDIPINSIGPILSRAKVKLRALETASAKRGA